MKTVNVEVTQNHIDNGAGGCRNCPVALAVNSHLKAGYCASAGNCTLKIFSVQGYVGDYDGHAIHACTMPEAARTFIRAFDREAAVNPISFELELPEGLLK